MRSPHTPRRRLSLVTLLSLGSLILGTALLCWALVNIRAQSVDAAVAYRVPASRPATLAAVPATPAASSAPIAAEAATSQPVLRQPATGDRIGTLSIPVLEQKWPIIEGTGDAELKRGVGHYVKSVLPGIEDNCVLSGHRDTVFSRLGKVKIGDLLLVTTPIETYTYQVRRIRIVDKDDRTVIVPFDHAVLTLSTCYPFDYVGSAPRRYVLIADLVPNR